MLSSDNEPSKGENSVIVDGVIYKLRSDHFSIALTSAPQSYFQKKNALSAACILHTGGIELTAPPPNRSAVRRTNFCATELFPKEKWSEHSLYFTPSPNQLVDCSFPTLMVVARLRVMFSRVRLVKSWWDLKSGCRYK